MDSQIKARQIRTHDNNIKSCCWIFGLWTKFGGSLGISIHIMFSFALYFYDLHLATPISITISREWTRIVSFRLFGSGWRHRHDKMQLRRRNSWKCKNRLIIAISMLWLNVRSSECDESYAISLFVSFTLSAHALANWARSTDSNKWQIVQTIPSKRKQFPKNSACNISLRVENGEEVIIKTQNNA